jgi:hypothetical protein
MTVELTADDWIDEAKSAERAEAWPQAVALWTRAASLCEGEHEDEQRCLAGIARCEHAVKVDAELASVAKRILNIPTLETRKSDALDFHQISVWQLLAALRLAYRMGRKEV